MKVRFSTMFPRANQTTEYMRDAKNAASAVTPNGYGPRGRYWSKEPGPNRFRWPSTRRSKAPRCRSVSPGVTCRSRNRPTTPQTISKPVVPPDATSTQVAAAITPRAYTLKSNVSRWSPALSTAGRTPRSGPSTRVKRSKTQVRAQNWIPNPGFKAQPQRRPGPSPSIAATAPTLPAPAGIEMPYRQKARRK